jgi:hypothetical protein
MGRAHLADPEEAAEEFAAEAAFDNPPNPNYILSAASEPGVVKNAS